MSSRDLDKTGKTNAQCQDDCLQLGMRITCQQAMQDFVLAPIVNCIPPVEMQLSCMQMLYAGCFTSHLLCERCAVESSPRLQQWVNPLLCVQQRKSVTRQELRVHNEAVDKGPQ